MTWPQIWNFTLSLPRELSTFRQEKTITLLIVSTIAEHSFKKFLTWILIGPCLTVALVKLSTMLNNMNLQRGHISKPAKFGSPFWGSSLLIPQLFSIILDVAFSCWIDRNKPWAISRSVARSWFQSWESSMKGLKQLVKILTCAIKPSLSMFLNSGSFGKFLRKILLEKRRKRRKKMAKRNDRILCLSLFIN